MPSRAALNIAIAAVLLELLPLSAAHGDDHMDVSAQDAPKLQVPGDGQLGSYWRLSEHATLMYWHIALEILAWVAILPIGVMLSIVRSRYTLPSQFAFLATNAFALVLGVVYDHKTPDLYTNNSHSKTGWAITWIASAWIFLALAQLYMERTRARPDDEATQPMTTANMVRYQRAEGRSLDQTRWSNDSGQGTERNSASLFNPSRSPSVESEDLQFAGPTRKYTHDEDSFDDSTEKGGFLGNTPAKRLFLRNVARFAAGSTLKIIRFLYVFIERTILVAGVVAFCNGTIVYGGIGKGGAIFNVLAHYIKGGVFFLYGIFTLGRWMGAFADIGWAWNVQPSRDAVGHRWASAFSAEFTESFLFFFYGVTNVFLEHLAAWGDAWTAQDLEHVSISVMFFGGGLLGMLLESTMLRDLLNGALVASSNTHDEAWQQPRQYCFSMNPMPSLVVLLLGKMMSSHHQASSLSTMIHSQWGSMFMGVAAARCLTYITLYVAPPTSYLPSRPPTEIITSFCLIAGGITFMLSNKDTVAALEAYGLDAMFTFTVTIGLVALLMAWTTIVIGIKSWAQRVESRSHHTKLRAGVLA